MGNWARAGGSGRLASAIGLQDTAPGRKFCACLAAARIDRIVSCIEWRWSCSALDGHTHTHTWLGCILLALVGALADVSALRHGCSSGVRRHIYSCRTEGADSLEKRRPQEPALFFPLVLYPLFVAGFVSGGSAVVVVVVIVLPFAFFS